MQLKKLRVEAYALPKLRETNKPAGDFARGAFGVRYVSASLSVAEYHIFCARG